jgi:cytochrome P450
MATAHAIPEISGLPVLGNMLQFRRDRLALFGRVVRECGEIGGYRVGPLRFVLSNSPQHAQVVLVDRADEFEKTPLINLLRPLLGDGLLTARNAPHRRQRQLVAPAFQHRRIGGYATIMAAYAEQTQASWTEGQAIDVAEEMMRLTLWIIGKTLFDADVAGESRELGGALTNLLHHTIDQVTSFVPVPRSWPTPRNRRARESIARLNATGYRMIAQRRASGEDKGDLLSMLLQASDTDGGMATMTDQQVRDEAMTLFMAGHETTANALAWAWYLLAQHPHVGRQVRAEVDRVLAGRTPTLADLPGLPYTLQVVKEAIRLYPPAYVFGRQASRPTELGDYILPAGGIINFSPYMMHRRADFYPEPERFQPERWTPEFEQRLPRHAYLPFGGGPRICIGNHFAMMEAQILLAALAQRVTFDLIPGQTIEPEPVITLRPKQGVKMVVRRRTPSTADTPMPPPLATTSAY